MLFLNGENVKRGRPAMEKGKNREMPEGAMEIDFFRSRRILQEKIYRKKITL